MIKTYVKSAVIAVLMGLSPQLFSQTGNISINLAGNKGSSAAILDLSDPSNSSLGFLLPNVTLVNATSPAPVTSPPVGLIVFNTSTSTSNGLFGQGLYYWSGSAWLFVNSGGAAAASYALSSGTGITSFTYNGSAPATVALANTTIAPGGTYGSTSIVPQFTVNAQGQITAETDETITPATIGMQNLTQGTGITPFTYNGSSPATIGLASTITAGGPIGSATTVPVITYNAEGQLTTVSTATIPTATVQGATNGLSISGTNVILGGTLTQATTINPSTFGLTIDGGTVNINNSTGGTTNIGTGTNSLTENGNVSINANNGAATTNIATGTATGAVNVGNSNIGTTTVQGSTVSINNGSTSGVLTVGTTNNNVGIGNTAPNISAILDLSNTVNKTLLLPVNASASNVTTPATGEVFYNSTIGCPEVYTSSAWVPLLVGGVSPPVTFSISGSAYCIATSGITYTVPSVSATTSITWSYSGTGLTYISGQGTSTLTINAGNGTNIISCTESTCGGVTNATNTFNYIVGGSTPTTPVTPTNLTCSSINTIYATQNTVQYQVTAIAGTTAYLWSSSNTNVLTVPASTATPTVTVTGVAAGTANLTCQATNGCLTSSSSTAVAITVNALTSSYAWNGGTTSVTTGFSAGSIQSITVPCGVTSMTVVAIGAGGAGSGVNAGGTGEQVTINTFTVTPGHTLDIVVGGGGTNGGDEGGGGGGGTFVWDASNTSVNVIAGGGGGAGGAGSAGQPANSTTAADNGASDAGTGTGPGGNGASWGTTVGTPTATTKIGGGGIANYAGAFTGGASSTTTAEMLGGYGGGGGGGEVSASAYGGGGGGGGYTGGTGGNGASGSANQYGGGGGGSCVNSSNAAGTYATGAAGGTTSTYPGANGSVTITW